MITIVVGLHHLCLPSENAADIEPCPSRHCPHSVVCMLTGRGVSLLNYSFAFPANGLHITFLIISVWGFYLW